MTTYRQAGPGSAPTPGIALRAARACLFGLVCVVLANVGHAMAGGCPGTTEARCAGLAGAVGVGLLLGRAECDLVALLSRLAACELALHLLFVQFPDRAAAHGGHPPGTGPAVLMLAGHLVAVLLTACWLRRGEAAVWSVLRLAAGRVRAVLTPVVSGAVLFTGMVRFALVTGLAPRPGRTAVRLPGRRGPPLLAC